MHLPSLDALAPDPAVESRQSRRTAGIGGHHSPASQTSVWLTPPELPAALGPFDLDPCACSLPRPWPTAAAHYTIEDDGLTKPWGSARIWLNPPYGPPSVVGPWMRRMAVHGRGTALIFARTETQIFHDTVWEAATAVLFLKGRLTFHRADGSLPGSGNAGAPSCLVAYGAADARRLRESGLRGKHIAL